MQQVAGWGALVGHLSVPPRLTVLCPVPQDLRARQPLSPLSMPARRPQTTNTDESVCLIDLQVLVRDGEEGGTAPLVGIRGHRVRN